MNMSNAAGSQALEEGKKRLRDFLESSETGRQAIGMTNKSGDSYEMKSMNSMKSSSRPKEEVEDLNDI